MIKCADFSKFYAKKQIISESNFEIRSNTVSFLMGPNGSGKTTLVKCIMGMENYSGQFYFDGKNINQVREKCLVIWDDCPFYTNISGINNLMLFDKNQNKKRHIVEIASKYIEFELLKNKVKTYSYGQKKKLALALVEILEPEYIVMDEISNGLDYDMMMSLKEDIRNWSKSKTILLTGHQFDFYNDIIDDLFIIENKQISLYRENFHNSNKKLGEIYHETANKK